MVAVIAVIFESSTLRGMFNSSAWYQKFNVGVLPFTEVRIRIPENKYKSKYMILF